MLESGEWWSYNGVWYVAVVEYDTCFILDTVYPFTGLIDDSILFMHDAVEFINACVGLLDIVDNWRCCTKFFTVFLVILVDKSVMN